MITRKKADEWWKNAEMLGMPALIRPSGPNSRREKDTPAVFRLVNVLNSYFSAMFRKVKTTAVSMLDSRRYGRDCSLDSIDTQFPKLDVAGSMHFQFGLL